MKDSSPILMFSNCHVIICSSKLKKKTEDRDLIGIKYEKFKNLMSLYTQENIIILVNIYESHSSPTLIFSCWLVIICLVK